MAAKDYQICCAIFNAYIAKPKKGVSNQMTDDRRVITENEILGLIDWYLDNELEDKHTSLIFKSCCREDKLVRLEFIDTDDVKAQAYILRQTEKQSQNPQDK